MASPGTTKTIVAPVAATSTSTQSGAYPSTASSVKDFDNASLVNPARLASSISITSLASSTLSFVLGML